MEREKALQNRYAELQAKVDELQAAIRNVNDTQEQQQLDMQDVIEDGFPEQTSDATVHGPIENSLPNASEAMEAS